MFTIKANSRAGLDKTKNTIMNNNPLYSIIEEPAQTVFPIYLGVIRNIPLKCFEIRAITLHIDTE